MLIWYVLTFTVVFLLTAGGLKLLERRRERKRQLDAAEYIRRYFNRTLQL